MSKIIVTIVFLLCQFGFVFSQENPDDLLKMLEDKPKRNIQPLHSKQRV